MHQTPSENDPVVAAAFARIAFDESEVDVGAAGRRFQDRQRAGSPRRYGRFAFGAAAACALAALVTVAPLRSLASNFLEIFEPQRVAPIALSAADRQSLRELPGLTAYGTVRQAARAREVDVTTALAAAQLTGHAVAVPGALPANVPATVLYHVVGRSVSAFTFSAARAAAAAAKSGATLPPMPANLNGSTLEATVGPIVIASYGAHARAPIDRRGTNRPMAGNRADLPPLVVAQMPVPRIASDGASVAAIESYLLTMPGVPSALQRQIAALRNPATTLPIPINIDKQYAQNTVIAGAPGLVIGDNTGLGAAVVWERSGIVYTVAGTLPARELIALASGLQ